MSAEGIGCICGSIHTYGGAQDPGDFDDHCPYHYPQARS